MIENISNSHPVARKDHICDLCGCVIPKGEKYRLQTNVYDGRIYNFACHSDCDEVASRLNFYGECDYDEGLTSEYFLEAIDQYIYDNHYDNEKDDTAEGWQVFFSFLYRMMSFSYFSLMYSFLYLFCSLMHYSLMQMP